MILRQTAALFLDAYRELNAKKLFWVTLFLSGLVVAAFAAVGINERGWTVLHWEVRSWVNTSLVTKAFFYKMVFSQFAVAWWLNWLAVILALVSTAGMIPDFIAGGSVDLYLSKPVSRARIFLTKYATGLLFVALQVLIFSAACYAVIGLRAGTWDARVFYAVPVVLLVFSYLFCVCVLIGLLTRSTVAALLLTVLFWLGVFGVNFAERILHSATIAARMETEAYATAFGYSDKELTLYAQRLATGDITAQAQLDAARARRQSLEEKKAKSDPTRRNVAAAHAAVAAAKAVLPKTWDTNDLLQRWLDVDVDDTELDEEQFRRREQRRAGRNAGGGWLSGFRDRTEVRVSDPEVTRELEAHLAARPASRIIGSSLAFEAVVLGIACWIFARRDY